MAPVPRPPSAPGRRLRAPGPARRLRAAAPPGCARTSTQWRPRWTRAVRQVSRRARIALAAPRPRAPTCCPAWAPCSSCRRGRCPSAGSRPWSGRAARALAEARREPQESLRARADTRARARRSSAAWMRGRGRRSAARCRGAPVPVRPARLERGRSPMPDLAADGAGDDGTPQVASRARGRGARAGASTSSGRREMQALGAQTDALPRARRCAARGEAERALQEQLRPGPSWRGCRRSLAPATGRRPRRRARPPPPRPRGARRRRPLRAVAAAPPRPPRRRCRRGASGSSPRRARSPGDADDGRGAASATAVLGVLAGQGGACRAWRPEESVVVAVDFVAARPGRGSALAHAGPARAQEGPRGRAQAGRLAAEEFQRRVAADRILSGRAAAGPPPIY